MPSEEGGQEFFLISNPIIIDESNQVDAEHGVVLSVDSKEMDDVLW